MDSKPWILSMAVLGILLLVLLLLPTTTPSESTSVVINHDSKCDDAENTMIFIVSPNQGNFVSNGNYYDEIKKAYDKFGLVLVQGLLDDEIIARLGEAGDILIQQTTSSSTQFSTVKFGPIFADVRSVFREVALNSSIPKFIAKVLLHLNESGGSTLRVVNDVFLSKGKEEGYCGWHVDDLHFWPTSASTETTGTSSTSGIDGGINAWIAIDDIPSSEGGGLAVVPKSHIAKWRHDAYNIIGSIPAHPQEGFQNAQDLYSTFPTTTCDLAKVAPELSSLMDNEAVIFNFTKGDVLLMNRWLWHKSIPAKLGKNKQIHPLKRYTIRYDKGSTRVQKGYSTHLSVMFDTENSGKSLDEISQRSGPFFPQAFPEADAAELSQFHDLMENKFPAAEAQKRIQMDEARKYFLARGQYYRS
jgi:ectoine hydroxylase-related dioxygenase (phytanoyl-CoA dioxygenase family)